MKICKYCGGECSDGAVFCEHCGSRFEGEAPEASADATEREQSPDAAAQASGQSDGRTEDSPEGAYREERKKKILDTVKSPLFIVLCVAELMALLSGIFINLTATAGSTITIPILSIFVCLCVWMIFISAKNRGEIPVGWVKALRVLATVMKVVAWVVFGCFSALIVAVILVPDEVYYELWNYLVAELARAGVDLSADVSDALSALRIPIKAAVAAGCAAGCAVTAIIAVFYGKLRSFLVCVEKESQGDLPGMYPAGVAGFCWFYVICSAIGFCFYLMAPPYNVFTLISYAADVTCAASMALIVGRIVNE
ncbi:MAG: zinc ribbon domain-containing protein [Clostridia bacterium]|nr:zinc ribbon domain-containing protein [Clostridia bacterium]